MSRSLISTFGFSCYFTPLAAFYLELFLLFNSIMKRQALLSLGAAMAGFMVTHAKDSNDGTLFPEIADTSHASAKAVEFFQGYFTAKSLHNATSWLSFFNPTQAAYYDATIGEQFPNRSTVVEGLEESVEFFAAGATSYPLRIIGDTNSALVHYVDTPGLFGSEIRTISVFDFLNNKLSRQVDYWDGRGNPASAGAVPDDEYPTDLGLVAVHDQPASLINTVAHKLNAAFSAGNATAATALFSSDAIFEDYTLRTRQEGVIAIGPYLQRALPLLPYGVGTTVRHVLGSVQGGGYEWQTNGQQVRNGVTALELDGSGSIVRFTTVWDGSRLNDTAILALAMLSVIT